MKRLFILALILFIAAGMVFAQDAGAQDTGTQQEGQDQGYYGETGDPNAEMMGIESAQQLLKEVSIDKFEHDGFWSSIMSSDEGYATSRLFSGAPNGKEPIPDEEGMDIPDSYVLGTRVDYLHRGYSSFTVRPMRPIPIEGVTKTISMWVVGRNFNHDMKILIQDFYGRNYEIYMGKLNFQGWKKLTVAIPPQAGDGINGVAQRSYHYNNQMGIRITGFRIECDPLEAFGSYYVYFDDLRAVTDLFAENNRDPDDMADGW